MRVNGAALIAPLLLQACFFEPSRPGNGPADGATDSGTDGQGSSSGSAPSARFLQHAWYCGGSASPNMQQTAYSISTSNIADGDLVLFIANIDNGSNDIFVLPPGFTKLYEVYYDVANDGQTFAVGYKIVNSASAEGSVYANAYGANLQSGCAVITLIGVTGYDPANPIDAKSMTASLTAMDPIVLPAQVTTTRMNTRVILAGGADWLTSGGSGNVTFTNPTGFDALDQITDTGGIGVVWASQLVASRVAATAGDTGPADARMMSTPSFSGAPWTIELAIAPAP